MYWRLKYVCVFVGEHFWCFLFDTFSIQRPFVIYLSSWRHVCHTGSHLWSFRQPMMSCTLLQRQEAFGSLPLKSGKHAWTLVQVWSLQCHFVLSYIAAVEVWNISLLFHLGNVIFYNTSESKNLRSLCWMAAVIWKKIQNQIYHLFSASKNTRISTD